MNDARARAEQLFRDRFSGEAPALVRAPGRVNMIGEHTDYNDGFVLPAAIDRELWIAFEPRDEPRAQIVSDAFEEVADIALDEFGEHVEGWSAYVQGVAWALHADGLAVRGWRGALSSDIPVGAGLSSSAALELGVARVFHEVGGWPWDPLAVAQRCQRAENEWVGLSSGLMDQLSSAGGKAGQALLFDCRSLETQLVPVPADAAIVILDTSTRRELTTSGYNDRRRECQDAATALGVASLRDVGESHLEHADLPDLLRRRARHVVTENARTVAAADAMRAGDTAGLGALMSASHRSLRDDFEVSSDAFDTIVAIAEELPGCAGARLTGGGFAGCAVALVNTDAVSSFIHGVQQRFHAATGLPAECHVCEPVDGASTARALEVRQA